MSTQIAQLIVQQQEVVIRTISLTMPVLRIGRAPESELVLDSNVVSRNHAEVRMGAEGPVLTDLGSFNGTFIGRQRLLAHQPHLLTDGANFSIGMYLFVYQAAPVAAGKIDEAVMPVSELVTLPQEVAIALRQPLAPAPCESLPQPVEGRESIYTEYLPDIYQENDFLRRFLLIFEDIWEPLELRQDHIDMYFDPRTCPRDLLPWLAGWLDVHMKPHWPEDLQRRLLSQAMELYGWRGTSYGLIRMIEVCTGLTPSIVEEAGQPFVFRISVTQSSQSTDEQVDRALLEELIQTHKPAHAGYILEVK